MLMLAYLLERELEKHWRDLETTVPEGITELGLIRVVELEACQAKCQKIPEPHGAKQTTP